MSTIIRTPREAVTASIEVKRSVFRCDLTPVSDEAAARAAVERRRKESWDARHHCSAFVLGADARIRRSNDDGEPSGTAGMPILDALLGAELTDVVAVVTRWFGGTLLGTGGLVKAYGDAVRAALAECDVERRERRQRLRLDVRFADAGRVEHALRTAGFSVLDVAYRDSAEIEFAATAARRGDVESLLAELTGGTVTLRESGEVWVTL